MTRKKEIEVVEYTREKKKADPNSSELVLNGETPVPPKLDKSIWSDRKDCVVVQNQPAIAMFRDSRGDIYVVQEDDYDDHDQVVLFSTEHAEKVANAILALAKKVG
jgi:hypothetical protein